MVAFALVSGRLFRAPESKTSKAGKSFAIARLKEGEGEAATWWELLAFGEEAAAELLRLRAGEGVSANGTFRVEMYTGRDGQARLQHKLFVDAIISTRKAKRQRDAAPVDARPSDGPHHDDRFESIPF